jgi:outer membrane protein assembly factor BamB
LEFWYVDRKTARCDLYRISSSGLVLDSIPITSIGASNWILGGAAWDGIGLWISVYSPDASAALYRINVASGQIDDTINVIGLQPTGITIKGDTLFYVNDGFQSNGSQGEDRIYAVNLITEDTLFSFRLPHLPNFQNSPRGLAWDGTNFWLLAEPVTGGSTKVLFKYDLGGSGNPGINVLTTDIAFGNVQIDSTSTANISIQNFGNANLILDSAVIGNQVFTLSNNFPVTIQPGEIKNLPLSFTPTASTTYNATVRFYHNDPNYVYSEVTVSGTGVYTAPYLGLSSSEIDFGGKRVNSTSYKNLTLTNLGSAVLLIDSVTIESERFHFEHLTVPVVIDSIQSYTFRVWFNPDDYTAFNDTIRIYSNSSRTTTEIPVTGNVIAFDSTLGSIVWQGQVPDNPATSFNDYLPRSMKKINDITGDGFEDIIIATENYWTLAFNSNSSGTADILWMFSSYINSNNAGSVDYVQGLQIAEDLNGDGSQDVIIGTGGGNEFVYALNGKTGEILWEFGDPVNFSNGDIMGLDVKRDWTGDGIKDVLVSASGNEFNGTGRFSIFLLNGVNGNIIWQINQAAQQKLKYMCTSTDFGGAVGSRVGTAYEVIGVNQTGQISWVFPTAGTPWTVVEMPDIGGSSSSDVLVGTTTGSVYVLSGDNGSVIWQTNIGNVFIEDARVISDINSSGTRDILISGIAPAVYVLEGSTGVVIWQQFTGGNILGISEVGDLNGDGIPEVGTASLNNLLHIYESRLGNPIFTYSFGGGGTGTAAEHLTPIGDVDSNESFEFVAGSRDGRIIAFSGGTDGTIPVELSSFSAAANGSDINLFWITTTELNNRGFEIERKNPDENNWRKISFVEGRGTTTEVNTYSYTDKDIPGGTYIYRLKQIDFDGTYTYSGEVEVNIGLPNTYSLNQNYPNPFNPITIIRYSLPKDENVKLSIYNILGEEIITLTNEIRKAGFHQVEWRGVDKNNNILPTGVYFYRLEAGSFVDVKKMMFLK